MNEVPTVGPEEASALVAGGAVLLDVREPEEWQAGHAPDALHIPLGTLGAELDRLPPGRKVVAVCRSGGRSERAARGLLQHGFDAVNLAGGMVAWFDAGFTVVTDNGEPGQVD